MYVTKKKINTSSCCISWRSICFSCICFLFAVIIVRCNIITIQNGGVTSFIIVHLMTQVLASICIIEKKLFMQLNASAEIYTDEAMEIKSVESFLVTGTKVEEQDFSYLTQICENLECLSFGGFLQNKPSRGVLRKRCFEYMHKFTGEHPCSSWFAK